MKTAVRERVKKSLTPSTVTRLRCLMRGHALPRWGNLRRTTPFSTHFGFDRGEPIDRHYLHGFLDAHRASITGDVLEVQSSGYTHRFGHDLRRTDSFDIVAEARPTFVCDLAHSESTLADASYDCLLLPNTLQHFRELDACLGHAYRVVRPGGTILATAAGFIPLTADVEDYWRLSPQGWRELLPRVWPNADVRVRAHGNCLGAVAALLGLASEELTATELDISDDRYPVLTTIVCRKPV